MSWRGAWRLRRRLSISAERSSLASLKVDPINKINGALSVGMFGDDPPQQTEGPVKDNKITTEVPALDAE